MQRITPYVLLASASILAGCGAENIQAPRPAVTGAVLDRSQSRDGKTFTFRTIDVPNALVTVAFGINARGHIVGTYVDAAQRQHGFRLRDGEYETIDFRAADGTPAAGTEARGIGPGGQIVGDYWFPGEPAVNAHGFALTKHHEFVPVDFPGHINTIAQRILPNGTILGCRHDHDTMGSMDGVIIGRHGDREIDQFASMNNGATPDLRKITGLHTNMATGLQEGFLIEDGVFTSFKVPGSITTAAWDMNPAGEIVGVFRDGTGFHGFVRNGDNEYTTIDVPGATATRAFGTNSRGDVVGSYVAGGRTHAFLATLTRDDDR